MKYCSHCGKEIADKAIVCIHCGCAVNGNGYLENVEPDIPSGGLNALAFLFPIVGLILYCVMIGKTPKKANKIGLFALIGFVIGLVSWVFLLLI